MRNIQKNKFSFSLASLILCSILMQPPISPAQTEPSLNDASAKGGMAVFKDFTKYPPESRPLDTSNWDLLHPWLTETTPLPMIPTQVSRQMDVLRTSGMADEEMMRQVVIPPGPKYQFEMNKTVLAGTQDQLEARLTVTPTPGSGETPRIHITKVQLVGDEAFGSSQLGTVPFACEEERPVCAFHWKAPAADKKYWGVLDLVVGVMVEGAADSFAIHQQFYSSPMVAGTFTGNFQERIENGSLVIEAGVQVQKRMACFVSANLFSVDKGIPTHHAERRMIVAPSMKTISFTFFGKIFRDGGHEGVFQLQDLKAQCENLSYPPEWFMDSVAHQAELQELQNHPPATKEPTRIYFAYSDHIYTTERYSGTTFSDREWQSPEQLRKLEAFKKAAAELDDPAKEQRKRELQQNLKK